MGLPVGTALSLPGQGVCVVTVTLGIVLGSAQVLGLALPSLSSQNQGVDAGSQVPARSQRVPWGWVPRTWGSQLLPLTRRVTHGQAQELQPGQERVPVWEQEVHQRQPPLQLLR